MLQPVFDFIEKFATDFTWKRLVIFFGIVAVVAVVFFLYEVQTATSQLSKYERSVVVIEKLESLKLDNKESKVVATNIYTGLVNITKPNSSPATFKASLSTELKQALLASAPWLFFCLFFIPGYFRRDADAPSIVGATIALSIIVGSLGYFIPVEWGSWFGFGVYPFGINILIFILLMTFGNKVKT